MNRRRLFAGLITLIAGLIIVFWTFPVCAAISAAERNALIALYNSTNGASWSNNSNWLGAEGTENTWFGVVTDAGNTRVLQIQLAANNLAGPLPAGIGDFPYLQTLLLGHNRLSGTIPADISDLLSLTTINLINNQLTGSIPTGLSRLSQLTYLSFAANQLTGSIPSELGALSNLQFLYLNSNQLSGSIPPELGNLLSLRRIYLDSNNLNGMIPSSLGNLSQLQFLRLGFNNLSGSIPAEIGNLFNLTTLYLGQNYLSGSIPSSLGSLTNLTGLFIQGNNLTGEIPDNWLNLTRLANSYNDFRWNGLYTNNATLRTFLNSKQSGGNWEGSQTIPPVNVRSVSVDYTSAQITWDIVSYRSDPGSYRVYYALSPGGPHAFYAATLNKNTTTMLVNGLQEGVDYYFVVRTRTDAHASNKGAVESVNSAEFSVQTLSDVISGYIRLAGGQGLGGATVAFSGGVSSVNANGDGYYARIVPHGWSGTATPSLSGYSFSPSNRTYNSVAMDYANENYTASPVFVSISGRITVSGGQGLANVQLQLGATGSTLTDSGGYYTAQVPYNWSGAVTPSLAGYTFNPVSRFYSALTASAVSQDYSAAPVFLTIAGRVREANRTPIAGVALSFSNGGGTVYTDNEGEYSVSVPYGWSGTAVPYANGWTFDPVSRNYSALTSSISGENYSGAAIRPLISGRVIDSGGNGLRNVQVYFSSVGMVTTDTMGNYSIGVPYNWSGTATPVLAGYSFNPSVRQYNSVTFNTPGQDFSAQGITPAITGRITLNGSAATGVLLTFSNNGGSVETNQNGDYSHIVPYGWTGTVTPSRAGLTFAPIYRYYQGVTADTPDQDFTAQAVTPIVSGRVTMSGSPVVGVTLTFSNNGGTVVTDQNGEYAVAVSYNWSGTVTPGRAGFSFTPANRSYSSVTAAVPNQDYTAQAITPIISGRIVNDSGTGLSGVVLTFDNGGGQTVTDNNGSYTQAVSYNWSGTVTPSRSGYAFAPANRQYSNIVANSTGQDYLGSAITPVISGRVTSSDGAGFPGVQISFSNGGGQTFTDNNGNYAQTVSFGWSGVAEPYRTGYSFTPGNRTYANVSRDETGGDFTAVSLTVSINGRVTNSSGMPLVNVLITFSPNGGSVYSDAMGYYTHFVPTGWSGEAIPAFPGYVFTPDKFSYVKLSSNQAGQNFVGAAVFVAITGKITDHDGTPLAGVAISFSNNGGQTVSDVNGDYSRTLGYGWSGVAAPSKTGYAFTPANRNYTALTGSISGQNFSANPVTPIIAGYVATPGGTGAPGVTLTFSNGGGTATTDANGAYSHKVPHDWNGSVTPSKNGYTFTPESRSYERVESDLFNENYTATTLLPEISGRIANASGKGIYGAMIVFSNGAGTTTSDANGYYSHTIPSGWSGTATPTANGFVFTPSVIPFSNVVANISGQDFLAAPVSPVVSGRVTDPSGGGMFNVAVIFSNDAGATTSDSNGYYLRSVPFGWSGTIEAQKEGFQFTPSAIPLDNVAADIENQNFAGFAITPVISGKVVFENGIPAPGVRVTAKPGDYSAVTNAQGAYALNVPYGWGGDISPSSAALTFLPVKFTVSDIESNAILPDFIASHALEIECRASRETVKAWLIKRVAGRIEITVRNPENVTVAAYHLKRLSPKGEWITIKSFPPSPQREFTLLHFDKYLEENVGYSYRASATDDAGVEIIHSETVSI